MLLSLIFTFGWNKNVFLQNGTLLKMTSKFLQRFSELWEYGAVLLLFVLRHFIVFFFLFCIHFSNMQA